MSLNLQRGFLVLGTACLAFIACAEHKGTVRKRTLMDTGKVVNPAVVVTGQVIDGQTRRPLEGALVLLLKRGTGEVSVDERTDSTGHFVTPGDLMLRTDRPTTISFRRFGQRTVQDGSSKSHAENFLTHVPEEMVLPAAGDTFDVGTILLMPGDMTDRLDVSVPRGDDLDQTGRPWRPFAAFGNPGLDFSWTRPNVTVRVVVPDSPAEKAGIKVGDVVVSVDGRAVDGFGPGAVRYLVGGPVNLNVKIVVRTSDGTTKTYDLQRFAG